MNYIRVIKASYNMNYRIAFTNVGKELVAKTFTLGGTLYKTCNVNEFDNGRSCLFGII